MISFCSKLNTNKDLVRKIYGIKIDFLSAKIAKIRFVINMLHNLQGFSFSTGVVTMTLCLQTYKIPTYHTFVLQTTNPFIHHIYTEIFQPRSTATTFCH